MRHCIRAWIVVGIAIMAIAQTRANGVTKPAFERLKTPDGIEFGILGGKPKVPAPTMFVIASDLETTLTDPNFNRVGMLLAEQGYLCVSLDAPRHGKDATAGQPEPLVSWREQIEKGDDLVGRFTSRCRKVLEHLIAQGYTDPKRIMVSGTSRGGFLAVHFAAVEPRVRCVVALAPVTDLAALAEFQGTENNPAVAALSLDRLAEKLVGRPVWIWIGNDDQRVGTDRAIAFARKLVATAKTAGKPAPVELHVVRTEGHSVGPAAHPAAAVWIAAQLKDGGS